MAQPHATGQPAAAHYPFATGNPYQALLMVATGQAGCRCQALHGGVLQLLKFVLGRTDCTVLHLHWIGEALAGPRLAGALARLLVFQLALRLWRLRGRSTVWTVHNLRDHGGRRPWLDLHNARLVARLASRLIVHGHSACSTVAATFGVPAHKIRVVHHGHYGSLVQAQPLDASHAGTRLLFFGQMRGYKGLPRLLQAFAQIPGPHSLRLAGSLTDPALAHTLQGLAARDARVSLLAGHQTDAALAQLLAWCDVVVLPYDDVFTSGSLLMAMTAGRATVAPRAGLVADYADGDGDGGVHFLYDPQAPTGLQQALQQAVAAPDLAARGARAGQQARRFDWATIGQQTAAVYREATGQAAAAPTPPQPQPITADPLAGSQPPPTGAAARPWVTVVVPVYNKQAHVARALASVLAQTDPGFLLVVVCDPSTDGSAQEVARFTDPRIQVLHRGQPGPGGYAARNLGVRAAATDWVAFLDADDTWMPDHLARLQALAAQHPGVPMLSAGWLLQDGGQQQRDSFSSARQRHGDQVLSAAEFLHWEARGARPVWTGVVCLRKALLVDAGGFPEDNIARSGDLDTWVRCVVAAGRMAWSAHVGGIYFRDAQNMVTRLAPVNLQVHLATTRRLVQATQDQALQRLLTERMNNLVINAWVSNVSIPQGSGFCMGPWLAYRTLLLQRPWHVAKCIAYDALSRLPGSGGRRIHQALVRARDAWRARR